MEAGVRRLNSEPRTFHILALDGGGMRGVFTAAVLTEIESFLGSPITDHVDLLAGTSTGGIIALGLAAGHSAEEMLAFYKDHGAGIFSRPRRLTRLFRPKYRREPLDRVLKQEFGEMTMNDLQHDVCITAHELVQGTTRVVKNDHHADLHWGGDRLVWKVAAATAAAPTYFAPVQLDEQDSHIDGGVWANNPALVGLIEAVSYYDRDLKEIALLSVGTTSATLRVENHSRGERMGAVAWGKRVLQLLQGSTSMASHKQVEVLLGPERYLRLDDELARQIKLDDVVGSLPLQERGQQCARQSSGAIRALLS